MGCGHAARPLEASSVCTRPGLRACPRAAAEGSRGRRPAGDAGPPAERPIPPSSYRVSARPRGACVQVSPVWPWDHARPGTLLGTLLQSLPGVLPASSLDARDRAHVLSKPDCSQWPWMFFPLGRPRFCHFSSSTLQRVQRTSILNQNPSERNPFLAPAPVSPRLPLFLDKQSSFTLFFLNSNLFSASSRLNSAFIVEVIFSVGMVIILTHWILGRIK